MTTVQLPGRFFVKRPGAVSLLIVYTGRSSVREGSCDVSRRVGKDF